MTLPPFAHRRTAARMLSCLLLVLASLGVPGAEAQTNLAPTITSFSPQRGNVGTTVTINGTNFTTPVVAAFGGNTPANITFTATQIIATVPNGASTGPITVFNSTGISTTTATDFVVGTFAPNLTSAATATGTVNQPFSYQITADTTVSAYAASGLPAGLTLDTTSGIISGRPITAGITTATLTLTNGAGSNRVTLQISVSSSPLAPFFAGQFYLGNGVYYLPLTSPALPFGSYSYLFDPSYIFHFDLGYEYVFDAQDGRSGVYLYDFASQGFFYTSPSYPFPYLYDFNLDSVLYYYPAPNTPGRYNTNGVRYFYEFKTQQTISK